ncbi:hypothetical protein BH23PSE2_BH23PSE2_10470 [soil metagenome]
MKRNLQNILACTLLAALPSVVPAQPASGAKKLYCWNENGIQVCGDTLPPSAVDRARTEISPRSGLRTGQVPRALTPEERAMEAEAAETAAEAADVEAAARRRDLAMVESYLTEADLRRAYGDRISLVDESMKTSRLSIAGLRQSLLSLLRQAAEMELQSRPVPPPLAANIFRQHGDLLRMQAMLDRQQRERSTLDEELTQAVERYRQMTAQPTQG